MNNNYDDDFSDLICSICRTGGDIICCDGRCLRSFHPKCIGLKEEDIPEDSPFVCSDCFSGIQRCFSCSHFGIENELVKCSVPFCGKFYHSNCVKTSIDSNNYVCKLHSCDSCGETITNSSKRKNLWRCFRCPKAFDSKHRPRDVHILAEGLFLCIRHTQEEEIWPEMSKDLSNYLETRNKSSTSSPSLSIQSNQNGTSNDSNFNQTNDIRNKNLILRDKNNKSSIIIKPDETEKERNEREATLRASSIMPKKRPLNESDEIYDEDTPRFSPGSIGENEDDDNHFEYHYDQNYINTSNNTNNNIHSLNSHLAKHNEYRRQRRILWNQSWNEYRDIQDERMGIRRRHIYNNINNNTNYTSTPNSQSNFSFITPLNTYSNSSSLSSSNMLSSASMSRTNALLSALSQPSSSSYSSDEYINHSNNINNNQNQNPSSTAILMRTSALLSQLTPTNSNSTIISNNHTIQQYNNSNNSNNDNNEQINKKIRYLTQSPLDNTSASLLPSSTLSTISTYGNGGLSRGEYIKSNSLPLNGTNTTTTTNNNNITLSRTEQLLNQNPITSSLSLPLPPSSNITISPSKYNNNNLQINNNLAQSNQHLLSRTAQMLAMTTKSPSMPLPSTKYHKPTQIVSSKTKAAPIVTKTPSVNASTNKNTQSDKMNATDLFAMLQASGLLPPK